MTDVEHPTNLRFFEILRKFSDDKHDPVPEWEFKGFITTGTTEKCICGTRILLNYAIVHTRTQKQLIIGSECVNRWLKPELQCEECGNPLGRVMERHRLNDFLCRKCKKEKAEIKRMQEERQRLATQRIEAALRKKEEDRLKKIERMGKLLLFWRGRYYQKPFAMVAEDLPYTEYLLNIPEEKATASILAFIDYANLLYEIGVVEVQS